MCPSTPLVCCRPSSAQARWFARRDRGAVDTLLDTTLLTNSRGEPALWHEIRAEIHSSDAIDVVMAFVRWSGIRPLLEALRRHCRDGKSMRIVTTTYTNSTFTVDLFNEGVDVPNVDTLLLLRPTESPTLFLRTPGTADSSILVPRSCDLRYARTRTRTPHRDRLASQSPVVRRPLRRVRGSGRVRDVIGLDPTRGPNGDPRRRYSVCATLGFPWRSARALSFFAGPSESATQSI